MCIESVMMSNHLSFCCAMKWISYVHTYTPSFWDLLHTHGTHLGHQRVPSWAPCAIQQLPTRYLISVQFRSFTQSCPSRPLMDCSMPGFPVHHQFPELAQTHDHWVSDANQPCHPLSFASRPAFNLSQHQGLFLWVSSSSGGQSIAASASASVLPMNIQDSFRLGLTALISLQSCNV